MADEGFSLDEMKTVEGIFTAQRNAYTSSMFGVSEISPDAVQVLANIRRQTATAIENINFSQEKKRKLAGLFEQKPDFVGTFNWTIGEILIDPRYRDEVTRALLS